jgi:hypothetical protein
MNYIDLSNTGTTQIYFSLMDSSDSSNCYMVLNGLATNVESVINLGTDYSTYPQRYNLYYIEHPEVDDLPVDLYTCRVYNSDDVELDRSYIQVIDSQQTHSTTTEIISPSYNPNDDDIAFIQQ